MVILKLLCYSFDVKWLKGDFSTYANIDKDQKLSDKEKKYLKAIHQRSGIGPLPKEPSKLDIQELVKVYGKFLYELCCKPCMHVIEFVISYKYL